MIDFRTKMRWDPYVLANDAEFDSFWQRHLITRQRSVLLILGRGFDPRMLETVTRLAAVGLTPEIWLLAFDNGLEDSEERSRLTEENEAGLRTLFPGARIALVSVEIGGVGSGNATSRNTRAAIQRAGSIDKYDDVIVDISAMPRMVALTVVAKLIYDLDKLETELEKPINLHVITAESVSVDIGSARGSLSDSVTFVSGFSGRLTAEATELVPRVWFPVLGEGQTDRLHRINDIINPDEICPVIPFPTKSPRRGDQIIEEHRTVLFEDFQLEPRNVLYACEYNPFEAYKQLYLAIERYRQALKELGGCKAFVSPVSSKLLSIGSLLACYDHLHGKNGSDDLMVGIPYVETAAYSDPVIDGGATYDLYSLWVRGEWEQ